MKDEKIIKSAIAAGVFVVVVGVILLIMHYNKPEEIEIEVIQEQAYIVPTKAKVSSSPVKFSLVSDRGQIDYQHHNGSFINEAGEESRFMPETMGPGVVLFDYDNDQDLDLFVTNSSEFAQSKGAPGDATQRLYRNDGGFRFADVTTESGLGYSKYAMGAVAADYDGDSHVDLLLTTWGGPMLLHNQGNGTFSDQTELLISDAANDEGTPDWGTGAVFFDADGDGDLDIYIANYVSWSPENDLFATIDGKNKSYATPNIYNGTSSQLFIQEDGKFFDRTAAAGLYNKEGKSLGVALWDFNDDGKLDIVVANDTQPNFLYYNLGDGRFEDRGLSAGIAYDENGKTRAGMGIDVADYANDGSSAIAIGNFSREPVSMFRQEGEAFFRESSQQTGVAGPSYMPLTFGLLFADFDLDGWQDLVMANGHIEPKIQETEAEISYRQPLILLGNAQGKKFVDWSDSAGGAFQEPFVGRGLATGDLDNDGDLDIVASENNGPIRIIRNDGIDSARHYLRVRLVGESPNTDAIGAVIEVHTNGKVQRRMVRSGSSYLSQSEMTQTFGLGENANVDLVKVRWPNGSNSEYSSIEVDTTVLINEGSEQLEVAQSQQ